MIAIICIILPNKFFSNRKIATISTTIAPVRKGKNNIKFSIFPNANSPRITAAKTATEASKFPLCITISLHLNCFFEDALA